MDDDYKNENNNENQPFEEQEGRQGQDNSSENERLNLTPEPEETQPEGPSGSVQKEEAAAVGAGVDASDCKQEPTSGGSKKTGKKKEKSGEKKKGFWGRLWSALKFIYMVITVPYFIMVVLFIVAFLAAVFSQDDLIDIEKGSRFARGGFNETVVIEGERDERIALIDVQNLITFQTSQQFKSRIKKIEKDDSVAAVIVRVTSPGGSVSASDQIHHYIQSFKEDTDIPVYSYMSGVAASGGYYLSAACDQIYAEPTTITGSIGVVLQSFNLETLMNEKLGVKNITVKSGEKKDWPKMFGELTQEQLDYVQNKLINPPYQRFVSIVAEGRDKLSKEQVLKLADGSIYYSEEAVNNGLIDGISYLEDLRDVIAEENGLENPEVFGFRETFSLDYLLRNTAEETGFFPRAEETLEKISRPELMYLWRLDN
ncbi:signal peptide peptidase SppA [Sedimentisphaera salicampi]|uniref:Signal peptide peptidase SppA n=1 Tax=Sedimentisphaera salicampi TaxID=1941349 RepID=A0A1W6LLT3_9BACT|nr:signal peptide peptidase SppA [Sedimentisphaera salicampi]ARN56760.1 Putative signal peptide peptidase SppA [Sedimentisphaera salicampi]